MNELEQKAFDMKKKGIAQEEIEQKLGFEFMFFYTPFDNKLQRASIWKPICKQCFNQ